MAYYSESAGYCAEDVRRPYAEPAGYYHGEGGGERYAVRKEYEEIDEVARAGRGHHHHGQHQYGHLGRSGSHHHHAAGHAGHEGSYYHGHLGEHRVHGHGGRHYDACESRRYDDSCTGQY